MDPDAANIVYHHSRIESISHPYMVFVYIFAILPGEVSGLEPERLGRGPSDFYIYPKYRHIYGSTALVALRL
jgi:hypothetical protein